MLQKENNALFMSDNVRGPSKSCKFKPSGAQHHVNSRSEARKGCNVAGLKGTIKGVGKGLGGAVYYPLKGLALSAEDIGLHTVNAGVVIKTKTSEQYAGAKKSIGYACNCCCHWFAVSSFGFKLLKTIDFKSCA